jgi:ADP-dependent NAD(P)H-hydrate dehydratase / NAD(P)H-hydrate epimerase
MSTPTSEPPALRAPDAGSNKYSRGKVLVIGGDMAGAAHLCAQAAMRSGAGYVELATEHPAAQPPYAMVQRRWDTTLVEDERIAAIAIGPGLSDDALGRAKLRAALHANKPTVIDAGALAILAEIGPKILKSRAPRVLTPHQGELERMFGPITDDRAAAVRDAALLCGAHVLLKGSETIIAAPDGQTLTMPPASPWLSTAGTGDVLTGVISTMLAQAAWHGFDTMEAIRAACWFHARAAELAGPALIADDLLWSLKRAVAKA